MEEGLLGSDKNAVIGGGGEGRASERVWGGGGGGGGESIRACVGWGGGETAPPPHPTLLSQELCYADGENRPFCTERGEAK